MPRKRSPGVLRLWHYPARVYDNPASSPAISVSTEINEGPKGTMKVPSAPQRISAPNSRTLELTDPEKLTGRFLSDAKATRRGILRNDD